MENISRFLFRRSTRICFVFLSFNLLGAVLFSCTKTNLISPASENVNSIAVLDILNSNYSLSLFKTALVKTGLYDSLNGKGAYTLFIPNNDAFDSIGIRSDSDIQKLNTDSLKKLLKYHIVFGQKLTYNDIPQSLDNSYTNGENLPLYLSRALPNTTNLPPNTLTVNGVFCQKVDVLASNGVIHILSQVLKYPDSSIQTYLNKHPEYSYFVYGLKQFHLWDQLGVLPSENHPSKGYFTLIAPTNTAFISAKISFNSLNKYNPAHYSSLLYSTYILGDNFLFISDLLFFTSNDLFNQNFTYVSPDQRFGFNFKADIFLSILYPAATVGNFAIDSTSNLSRQFSSDISLPPYATLNNLARNGIIHPVNTLLVDPKAVKF